MTNRDYTSPKKSFLLYRSQRDVFEALNPREVKELILAIYDFADGKSTKLTPRPNIAFISIKGQLERDFEKWENNSEKRREYGRLGGLAKASKSYLKPVLLSKPAVDVDVDVDVDINKDPLSSKAKTYEEKAWAVVVGASAAAKRGGRP